MAGFACRGASLGCKQAAGGLIGVDRLRSDARAPTEPAHTPHSRSVGHGVPLRVAESLNAPLNTRDRPHFGRSCGFRPARRPLRQFSRSPRSPALRCPSAHFSHLCVRYRSLRGLLHRCAPSSTRGARCETWPPMPRALGLSPGDLRVADGGERSSHTRILRMWYVQAGIETPRPRALAVKISASSGNCVASADP